MDSAATHDRQTEDFRNLTRRIMGELTYPPCALMIEQSFYTQSKHDEQIVSYAHIVLRLVVTAGANCTSRVIIKPFSVLLDTSQGGAIITPPWAIEVSV